MSTCHNLCKPCPNIKNNASENEVTNRVADHQGQLYYTTGNTGHGAHMKTTNKGFYVAHLCCVDHLQGVTKTLQMKMERANSCVTLN